MVKTSTNFEEKLNLIKHKEYDVIHQIFEYKKLSKTRWLLEFQISENDKEYIKNNRLL